MKAIAEFRVPESYAKEFLPTEIGRTVMDFVRIIQTPVGSQLYEKIGDLYQLVMNRDNKYFFLGWDIKRVYSKKELESAELLLLKVSKTFEPAGIECGTLYSNTGACNICGAGIQQISDLILDLRTIPKNVNIARTISNEIVIDQEFAKVIVDNKITGCTLGPLHHNGKSSHLLKKNWHQLIVNSFVNVNSATKTGIGPFDEDKGDEYRCKKGHTIGLNVLSDISIDKVSWDGSDFTITKELLGVNRGLLRTYPLLLISQRLYKLIREMKFKGFKVEVVKLIN